MPPKLKVNANSYTNDQLREARERERLRKLVRNRFAELRNRTPERSSDEETSSDDEGLSFRRLFDTEVKKRRPKGVSHLIEVENPNRVEQDPSCETEADAAVSVRRTRITRDVVEKPKIIRARAEFMKLHEQGLTDLAREHLAKLEVVRREREEKARLRLKAKKEAEERSLRNKIKLDMLIARMIQMP